MFTFLARFLKGVILGWITTLIIYLIKRMLTKAFGNMPAHDRSYHPEHSEQFGRAGSSEWRTPPDHNIVDTLWEGMSAGQLRQSFGSPQEVVRSGESEVWVYANLNGQNTTTSVTLENGIVTYWRDTNIPRKAISGD